MSCGIRDLSSVRRDRGLYLEPGIGSELTGVTEHERARVPSDRASTAMATNKAATAATPANNRVRAERCGATLDADALGTIEARCSSN